MQSNNIRGRYTKIEVGERGSNSNHGDTSIILVHMFVCECVREEEWSLEGEYVVKRNPRDKREQSSMDLLFSDHEATVILVVLHPAQPSPPPLH